MAKSRGRPEGSSGAKTRARLLEIAATLFANRGFAGVTMADVAGAAGFTAPSIYNHFSSKDELFVATVTHMYEDIAQGFRAGAAGAGDWQARIGSILDAAAGLYRDDGVLQRLSAVAQLEASQAPRRFAAILAAQARVVEVFTDVVAQAVGNHELPEDIDVALTAELLTAMVTNAIGKVTLKRSSHTEFLEVTTLFKALFLPTAPETKGAVLHPVG